MKTLEATATVWQEVVEARESLGTARDCCRLMRTRVDDPAEDCQGGRAVVATVPAEAQATDGIHASRCRRCVAEEDEVRRWASLHLDRACRECGTSLPRGRRVPRCVTCQRKVRDRRAREKIALGCHRCAMCHDPLPLGRDTYCQGGAHMLNAWRRAWHAGNPVARQLGTVRTTRRWQQETP